VRPALSNTRGEHDLIAAIRARLPENPAWLAIGIGDDAAVVEPPRGALEILTTDAIVEGIHFDRRFSSARDIGWKALAVNLSDIAAMGGTPRLALLSLGLPADFSKTDTDGLLDGFLALAAEARVTLAGGNITRSPGPLLVDVTAMGFARRRHILTRAGAKPGDDVFVTGDIGAATAGLSWLRAGTTDDGTMNGCADRHRRPLPRVRIGTILGRNRAATACMDLSDGLADAARQVAAASGVGMRLDASALPISDAARNWFAHSGVDPVDAACAGGDDYELLFTVPRRRRGRLATVTRQSQGIPVTRIGVVTAEPDVLLVAGDHVRPLPEGFAHF